MREGAGDEVERTESRVQELLERRDWTSLAEWLGYSLVRIPLPPEASDAWGIPESAVEKVDRVEVLAADDGYRLILVEGVANYAAMRRAILSAYRRNPAECVFWWLVSEETITVAIADSTPEGRNYVRRMETRLSDPDPVGLRQWIQFGEDALVDEDLSDPGAAYARHVIRVLRQESMTREFFESFSEALELLTSEMKNGPEGAESRHDVALATLLRLVFLYFLQERGALDDDRRFVLRHYRRVCAQGRQFYAEVLAPLYFEALNCEPEDRSDRARELGDLPFLNGGLFEPLPAEREHPELGWDNDVWSGIVEELFERFHFTVDEGVGPDENRAVDPEMLGKVFEGLMYGERRHESGSFYTPRDVVRRVVTDAIVYHFSDETGLTKSILRSVVEGESVELRAEQRREIEASLESFHLLDPAVGTGAFMLESLRVVARLYRAAGSDHVDNLFELRRRVVHRHLFGVDLQETAVRICSLRLWLALLSAMPSDWEIEEIPPLPNLSHRIGCGNSLFAPADRVRLGDVAELPGDWQFQSLRQMRENHRDEIRELEDEYLEAHGRRKAELARRMEALEREVQRRLLEGRIARLEEKLAPYVELASSRDLFGREIELDRNQRRERESLESELDALRDVVDDLESGRARGVGFSYAARFGATIGEAGFDVVVTNPPWIRANRLERATRSLLKKRYRSFSNDLWSDASRLGISVPFGVQVDIAAVFVERCLELLRTGGHLGALLPANLFRSLHGSGVRGVLAGHEILSVCDYAEADRDMFEATVYPATVQVRKSDDEPRRRSAQATRRSPRTQERPFELSVWRGQRRCEWKTTFSELPARGSDPREPWLFVPPHVAEVFRQMWDVSRALGEFERFQPRRGVMTGRNEVFVQEETEVRELFGAAADEWTRPVISGRDVREWSVSTERRILWPYDTELRIEEDLPEDIRSYFEQHRSALEERADFNASRPLWQLFRLKEGLVKPKVVWRDLSPRLEAAPATAEAIPLNTVYFLPFETGDRAREMAAFLNSEPVRSFAHALAERARGGWRRHFAWVIRMLPVPEDFVVALGDSSRPFQSGGEEAKREADWVAGAFQLDASAVGTLREWRTAGSSSAAREAA